MRRFRIAATIITVLAIILGNLYIGTTYPVYAEETEIIHTQDNGITYLEDSNGYLHYYYDSSGNPISVEEARSCLTSSEPITYFGNTTQGAVYNYASYYTQNQISGTRTKVTADVAGPASITYGVSVTTTATWSYSFQVGFKNVIINTINVNATVSYSSSASSASSFGITYSVPSGKIGAVYFTPYIMNTYVRTWDADGVYRMANIRYPKRLSTSFNDGLYELVLK